MANGPDGTRFVWGRIEKIHEVGPYSIVEFTPTEVVKRDKALGLTSGASLRKFHPYVDGKDLSEVAPTLDGALALAIAARHNAGTMAAYYFMKMVAP